MANLTHESRKDRPFVAVSNEGRPAGHTYEPYYGLTARPFALAPDVAFYYQSRVHAPALEDLLNGIRRREPVSVLTGAVGTGKTVLCRALIDRLDRKTVRAFVPGGLTSRTDLLKILLVEFGAMPVDELATPQLRGASRTELRYRLSAFLETLAATQTAGVVFVDDAQRLPLVVFEELRLLSDEDERLQLVLVGQDGLSDRLGEPTLGRIQQRVGVSARLEALDRGGVEGYVASRLSRAGGSADRISFSAAAIDALHHASAGVPRVINRLCDRALYEGYLRRAATIEPAMLPAVAAAPIAAPSSSTPLEPMALPSPSPMLVPIAVPSSSTTLSAYERPSNVTRPSSVEAIRATAPAPPSAVTLPRVTASVVEPVAPAPSGEEAARRTSEALAEWLGRIEPGLSAPPEITEDVFLFHPEPEPSRPPRRPGAIVRITLAARKRRMPRGYTRTDRFLRRWKRRLFMALALISGVGGGLLMLATLTDILAGLVQ